MWFVGIKKKGPRSINSDGDTPSVGQLIKREHLGDLHVNNAELRFWLPELCKQALQNVTEYHGALASQYLREFFVVYVYGEHELLHMRINETGIYHKPPPPPEEEDRTQPRFSIVEAAPPDLGKNIAAVKLFLPEKLKSDLQALADDASASLSSFVRQILVSHLLGHDFWPGKVRSWSMEEEGLANFWAKGGV